MEGVLEIKQLSCKMGKNYLLRDINWQVNRGEQWIVYGMNGSGKTTLLSIIAGYKHYTEGSVRIFGEPWGFSDVLKLRQKIGFVSSSFFDKHYSRENVLDIVLSGKTGALGLAEDITLADALQARRLLRRLNLGNKLEKQFDMLSKGERQIVLLARALFNHPKLLLLDEPMSGLDIYNREYLFQLLEELKDEVTMIYVTHQAEEISGVFNKGLLLKKGHVFAQGDLEEVLTGAKISALLGYPAQVETDQRGRKKMTVVVESAHGKRLFE